jgi:hypothetical protein
VVTVRVGRPRLGTVSGAVGIGIVLAVVGAGVVRAQGQGKPAGTAGLHPDKTNAKPSKTSPIPTIAGPGILPTPGLGGNAAVQGNGETLGGKVLSVVPLPPLNLYAYPVYSNVPDPAFPGHVKQISYAWVISDPTPTTASTPPSSISYGTLPTAHVTALAFGAIPVTADVTLSQTIGPDGRVEPIEADLASATFHFTVSGSLDVRISNVSVDGMSLQLSAACTTVRPATLIAHATNTQYNVFTGGSLSGNVEIPDFTGCTGLSGPGETSEDLDPLFDGTISGSTNPTFLTQAGLGTFNPAYKDDCQVTKDYPLGCTTAPALPKITASEPVPTVVSSEYDPPPG